MKQVTLEPGGRRVSVHTEDNVLEALLSEKLNVMRACGGKGLCATCHVWIESGMQDLTPMTAREKRTLGRVSGANERSRLSCQACILGDDVVVSLPDGMFVESFSDLESLVGKRAQENILHPIDMRVLVEKGKIIVRSRIMELRDLDVDMQNIRSEAATL